MAVKGIYMRSFKIKNLKNFMNQLLLTDTFDYFSVSEAVITTFVTFTVDGSLHPDFYDPETARSLKDAKKSQVRWSGIRSLCYSIIRGKRPPVSFRIIFLLPEDRARALCVSSGAPVEPENISGLFLNLHYSGTELSLTTGTSLKIFTMDKTLEHAFDAAMKNFLLAHDIDFDES